MQYYNWYKDNNICVDCKEYTAAPNRVRCEVCLVKSAEKRRNRPRNDLSNAKFLEYQRKLRADRKAQGLCIECGKPQCSYSVCYCLEHRLKALKRNNKRAKKTDVPIDCREDLGICKKCGATPLVEGKKLCQRCYECSINNLRCENAELGRIEWRSRIQKANKLIFRN